MRRVFKSARLVDIYFCPWNDYQMLQLPSDPFQCKVERSDDKTTTGFPTLVRRHQRINTNPCLLQLVGTLSEYSEFAWVKRQLSTSSRSIYPQVHFTRFSIDISIKMCCRGLMFRWCRITEIDFTACKSKLDGLWWCNIEMIWFANNIGISARQI